MKDFHFSKTYFNKLVFNDDKIRVVVKEIPSLEVSEEEYSLRVETRHEEEKVVHRNYAIEHHLEQEKHSYPHLQFKFHTEEIGTFRIRLYFENQEEYRKAILGFIYKIKNVLGDLEKYSEGITNEILVASEVDKLVNEGDFLTQKISEGLGSYAIEFDDKKRHKKLKENPLLVDFIGEENVKRIMQSYQS